MIQYIFGDGKGKTTSAIGSAIRMAGIGKSVLITQFYKNNDSSEVQVLKSIKNIEYVSQTMSFTLFEDNEEVLKKLSDSYVNLLKGIIDKSNEKEYGMIVLDEFQYLYEKSFSDLEKIKIKKWLKDVSINTEVVITGHSINEELLILSDYVSEIKKIKHPYDKGIDARKGVEY